jgi:very-short-patch-repair endonuclease
VDFYFPDKNIIIEYNGHQHYQPVRFGGISLESAEINFIRQQYRDKYLQNFCDQNNITLIWIDGRTYTYKKLESYIIETIIPLLK